MLLQVISLIGSLAAIAATELVALLFVTTIYIEGQLLARPYGVGIL